MLKILKTFHYHPSSQRVETFRLKCVLAALGGDKHASPYRLTCPVLGARTCLLNHPSEISLWTSHSASSTGLYSTSLPQDWKNIKKQRSK